METIYVNDKVYKGIRILESEKFCIYLLNRFQDKYLVLRNNDGVFQDMIITGDKINDFIKLVKGSNEEEIRQQLQKKLEQIKQQSYNKKLKMIDAEQLKRKVINFYDKNYPSFVFMGIRLPELLKNIV